MKVICKYIVFMLFIYNFNIFNIDAEKPFSGTLNKVYVCMYVCISSNAVSKYVIYLRTHVFLTTSGFIVGLDEYSKSSFNTSRIKGTTGTCLIVIPPICFQVFFP